jgi:NADH-quinone oxidoreductase subunit C
MADDAQVAADAGDEAPAEAPAPEELHGCPVTYSRGQKVLHVPREQLTDTVANLRDDSYLQCLDVTAVDYLGYPAPRHLPASVTAERFELVVTLISHQKAERIRLRVQVPAADPTVDTLFTLHPGTEAMEREVFDMFGITFTGHPDLTRVLMPEDWEGHPLRKDYAVGRIPVQFKGAPSR